MKEPSASLLLNGITHPVKFIWRFLLLYSVVLIPFSLLPALYNFFSYSMPGKIIYIIAVVRLTLQWVRSSVYSDYEADCYESLRSEEDKAAEKERNTLLGAALITSLIRWHHIKKIQRQMEKEEADRRFYQTMASDYDSRSNEASRCGNQAAADEYDRQAWFYRNML